MPVNRSLPPRLQALQTRAPQQLAERPAADIVVADDMLNGAAEIQAFLGFKSVKQVYHLTRSGDAPIKKIPGLGLSASKKALTEWYAATMPGLQGMRSAS